MLRKILGAVAGYAAMVVVVLAGIALAWAALGAEGVFAGEGPTPSTAWMVSNLVGGLVAALAGGWVGRRVGGSVTSVRILVGLILVLGVVSAVIGGGGERQPLDKPVAELSFSEAGQYAVQPAWYNWVIPLVGAVGAAIGGRITTPDP